MFWGLPRDRARHREGVGMSDEKIIMPRADLARWLLVALVILTGIVLFFVFGPDTPPAITPTVTDL